MDIRAAVTFPAPHGTESVVLHDGDEVAFGRSASCPVRFAYAPVADESVPRVAGRLLAAGKRVFVDAVGGPGRRAIEVLADGRPPVLLALGEGYAPSASEFRVTVHGERAAWNLSVFVRDAATVDHSVDDVPTRRFELALTQREKRVLEAYAEPWRRGRIEPATHREVAAVLACHPNSARETLYVVWARMVAAGIPMPDVSDKRVAVVESARLHGLLVESAIRD